MLRFYDRQGKIIIPSDGIAVRVDGDGFSYAFDMELIEEWSKLMEDSDNRVIFQWSTWTGVFVSTIWLGIDYNFNRRDERPLIFETMAFAPLKEGQYFATPLYQKRYHTEQEAKEGHIKAYIWFTLTHIFKEFNEQVKNL